MSTDNTKNTPKKRKQAPFPLKEGVHFYLNEQGLMVFTEQYHLERGYCCGSGCRHCPYGTESNER